MPVALITTGLIRALWALRVLTHIGVRRAVLAFATWLSLSWTTALACLRGLVRRDGVFLRTPKWQSGGHLVEALRETRIETALAVGLACLAGFVTIAGDRWSLGALAGWQSVVFATSPYMAWLNQRTELSARLARRARSEDRRDRVTAIAPAALRTTALGLAAAGLVAVFVIGGSDHSTQQTNVFDKPIRPSNDRGPLGNLGVLPTNGNEPATTTTDGSATSTSTSSGTTTTSPGVSTTATSIGTTTTSASTTTTSTPGATSSSTPTPPTSTSPPSSGPPTSPPGRP